MWSSYSPWYLYAFSVAQRKDTMAHLEVFEGTWEELAARADTFKGRQLRLIVLPVAPETTESTPDELRLREAAARLLAEADHIEREPGPPRSDPSKAAFGEIVAEKHRKMGLQLCP
jgi:hypothetical protein